jgi:hypothetical protein
MNDELERIWKEAVAVIYFKVLLWNLPGTTVGSNKNPQSE